MELVVGDESLFRVLGDAKKTFGTNIVFLCSFSNEDMIILDCISRNNLGIDVYTIDTGRLNPETYEFINEASRHYGIKLNYIVPEEDSLKLMLYQYGPMLFYDNVEYRKLCCRIRKVDPLLKLLSGKKAWISGIRSEQTEERNRSSMFENNGGMMKINPIINWTQKNVRDAIERLKIPSNKLYSKGYKSIGCQPCTRPVYDGESERDGRWWWENGSKECGIHISRMKGTR